LITAVIPVKTQSERLPSKNLRYFGDYPLYEHKLRQIEKVKFDRVVVSSESKEVIETAKKYGYEGHLRNPKYSTPEISMNEVWSYVCSEVPGDDVAWVNVNNPLVGFAEYEDAIRIYKYKEFDSLISVSILQKYVWYKGKPINFIPTEHPKSQDLADMYAMNFAINIRNREAVIKEGTFIGKNPRFFTIDPYIATKVDYQEDLDFCLMLWKQKYKK
jgi:N-acylneuraminate cytidylyltransferase